LGQAASLETARTAVVNPPVLFEAYCLANRRFLIQPAKQARTLIGNA
jgi:hypothetical protein